MNLLLLHCLSRFRHLSELLYLKFIVLIRFIYEVMRIKQMNQINNHERIEKFAECGSRIQLIGDHESVNEQPTTKRRIADDTKETISKLITCLIQILIINTV